MYGIADLDLVLVYFYLIHFVYKTILYFLRGGRDLMVVGFITTHAITTNVVISNPAHGEVYSIQHYVIKFVSDLQQVSCV